MAARDPVNFDNVVAPAERALSFLSKSFSEAQRNAESDMKLLAAKVQSFKELSTTLDREWASLKNTAVEDFDFLKCLSSSSPSKTLTLEPVKQEWGPNRKQRQRRVVVLNSQGGRKKKVRVSKDWEPLTRMKQSLEESLKELQNVDDGTEQNLTLKESLKVLQNVDGSGHQRSAESLEKVGHSGMKKNNLKLTTSLAATTDKYGKDVPPLDDVPEMVDSMARQTEPLLNHLGFEKEVSEKVCEMLRSCKRKDLRLSTIAAVSRKDLGVSQSDASKADELDLRIASVVRGTGYNYRGGILEQPAEDLCRNIAIVTTASLPWMTGTAVNPLFRAAYLARSGEMRVTLLVPWLCKKDQEQVYPNRMTFASPADQEIFIRSWVEERAGFKSNFKIAFYPGKFSTEKRSILAAGDISQFIPDKEADVAILEEPEHLTWYYHGKRWTDKFQYVVGVVHTNYLEYVKREKNGRLQAFFLKHVNTWVVRIYCDKVLRLSAATQDLPRSLVCNVHGVNPQFLKVGKSLAELEDGETEFSKGAYYLGKMIWGKGYRELVDLLAENKNALGNITMDVFGSGEDSEEVQAEAQKHGLAMNFHKGIDHADALLYGYKVFVNPSISDVVCTTTAEALAMGKIVVCADHPSNDFFHPFPNCLQYRTSEEFVEKVKLALSSEPIPLSPDLQHLLSWEAATDRFIDSADLNRLPPRGTKIKGTKKKLLLGDAVRRKNMTLSLAVPQERLSSLLDRGLAIAHYFLSGLEVARWAAGALPGTMNINEEFCKDLGLPPPPVRRLHMSGK